MISTVYRLSLNRLWIRSNSQIDVSIHFRHRLTLHACTFDFLAKLQSWVVLYQCSYREFVSSFSFKLIYRLPLSPLIRGLGSHVFILVCFLAVYSTLNWGGDRGYSTYKKRTGATLLHVAILQQLSKFISLYVLMTSGDLKFSTNRIVLAIFSW